MRGLWKHWALKRVSSHWFAGFTMGGPWGWNPHSLPVAQTQLAAFAAQLILALCLRRHFGDSPVPRMPQEAAVRGSRQAILEPAFSNRRSCSLSCTTSRQGKGVECSSLWSFTCRCLCLGSLRLHLHPTKDWRSGGWGEHSCKAEDWL